ncbi:MAG: ADP-glyceromanno-heptose 6-epimerase [Proteobacteria bacterium]|nr:ADP-glyceromanno-heptose 6-epimerase [Pseudomonadota bacterium]MCL2308030.1 ADP-glyceromanno-heptose 6-epimerase [Pseudomonadota bacterium]
MYIVVTGAAGFIGANLVKALNARGENRIIAVDHLARADKFKNLVDCDIADYFDRDEFLDRLEQGDFDDDIRAILHQGACSDTMETDGGYMMRNNYRYSMTLLEHCQNNDVPLIYASSASVYGAGKTFVEERAHEAPLNVYGYSKFLFDQSVRRILPEQTAPIVGLRYFNVYGPREQHKGRMASVVWHFFNQYKQDGKIKLFDGSDGYAAGEQRRDFVSVEDVVKVNLYFLDHPQHSGIFNLGTGRAESFNAVALATLNALAERDGKAARSLQEWVAAGAIEYVPFPSQLAGKYQSYTQADLKKLREAGYREEMFDVATGVARYMETL